MADTTKKIIIQLNAEGNLVVELEKANEELDKTKKKAKEAGDQFGLADTQIGKMATSVKEFGGKAVTAMKTFKGAMAATGIGLLVVAIGGLVNWIKNTQEGSAVLAKGMKILGQVIKEGPMVVFNALKLYIQYMLLPLRTLIATFKHAKAVLSGKESFAEAVQGVKDDVKELAGEMKETAGKIGDSFNRITQGATGLADMEAALAKRKRDDLKQEAQLTKELEAAKLKMDDATASEAERMKAINEAAKITNELTALRLSQAQDELAVINKKIELGDAGTETLDEQAAAQANLDKIEAEGFAKSKEFADKKSAILQKSIDEQAAIRQKAFENQVKATETTGDLILDIEKGIADDMAEIDARLEAENLKDNANRIKAHEDYLTTLKELDDENALLEAETEEEYQKIKDEQDRANFLAKLEEKKMNAEEINTLMLAYDKKYSLEKGKIDKQTAENEKETKMRAAAFSAQVLANGFNLLAEIAGESTKLGKAAATAGVIADAAAAIISTWTGYSKFGPWGTAAAIIQTASIGVTAGKSIQSINSVKEPNAPKFALGGYIGGASHQNGGVSVNAEGGEFIVNKRTMANPMLAQSVLNANSMGNGGMGSAGMLSEERVIELIGQSVKAIPVYVVESEMTDTQRKVQVREQSYVQ